MNVTVQKLFEYDAEIQTAPGSIIEFMVRQSLQPKVRAFYQKNGERIKSLSAKGEKIMKEWVEVDENNKPIMETVKTEGKPDQSLPKMLEGKLWVDAQKAIEAFHNEIVVVDL